MTDSKNVIELNGNLYDALTGAYLRPAPITPVAAQPAPTPAPVAPATPQPASQPVAVAPEPVVEAPAPVAVPVVPVTPKPEVVAETEAAAEAKHRHSTAARRVAAHRPQPTKTLMRHAVTAPNAEPRTPIKLQSAIIPSDTAIAVKTDSSQSAIQPKASATNINPQRSQRAMDVNRSGMVQRFRPQPKHGISPALTAVAPASQTLSQPAEPATKPEPVIPALPIAPPIKAMQPQAPRPRQLSELQAAPVAAKPSATAAAVPVMPKRQPQQPQSQPQPIHAAKVDTSEKLEKFEAFEKLERLNKPGRLDRIGSSGAGSDDRAESDSPHREKDIFEQALAKANSHQQQAPKQSVLKSSRRRKHRRLTSIMTSVAVFLLLIGVVAYQNRTSIQLQLASAKAGFAASAPGYKPSGYKISKISYGPGTIATTYEHSGKSFSVIQKKSNWDSQTLLENFVATSNESYQGYQSNGRTIYVYGEGRATWVNGGIWYQIQADNVLPNDQIVKIASSM